MNHTKKYFVSLITIIFVFSTYLSGKNILIPRINSGLSYKELKSIYSNFLLKNPSEIQKVDLIKRILKPSTNSSWTVSKIYRDFSGKHSINTKIPGMVDNILYEVSKNRNLAQGARRTHLYATEILNHPDFELKALNQNIIGLDGKIITDRDIVLKLKNGGNGRIEVKEVSPASQRSNLKKLKTQIDKMAIDMKKNGTKQYWINRKPIIPEIAVYSKQRGIKVFGNVGTGQTHKGAQFSRVLQFIKKDLSKGFKKVLISKFGRISSVEMVSSIAMKNGKEVLVSGYFGPKDGSKLSALIIDKNAISRNSTLFDKMKAFKSKTNTSIFRNAGAKFGILLIGTFEIYDIYRYTSGRISGKQFLKSQASFGGSMAGAFIGFKIGAWAGGILGSIIPIAGTGAGVGIGGTIGSIIGGVFGHKAVDLVFEKMGKIENKEDAEKFRQFVLKRYNVI